MKKELLTFCGINDRMREQLEKTFNIHQMKDIENLDAFLDQYGESIEGIATTGHDGCPQPILDRLPNLKIMSSYGVGYDGIDTDAANKRNIVVTHTPNVLNNDVANTAILLMLAVSRRIIVDDKWVRSGNWLNKGVAPLTQSIEGVKVGILGMGRIGETIAKKLKAFDCEIFYHTRNKKDVEHTYYDNLVDMAKDVDYLIAILPGGAATDKIINKQVMEALGPQGTLINVARGSVVDEPEMVTALKDGRLGAAGLDVFVEEPIVPTDLFDLENVVLLPHVGSATVQTRQAMGDLTVENLIRYFAEGKVSTPVWETANHPAAKK